MNDRLNYNNIPARILLVSGFPEETLYLKNKSRESGRGLVGSRIDSVFQDTHFEIICNIKIILYL